MSKTLKVEPEGFCRYHVKSESSPGVKHLVDLLANYGQGECSCVDWQTRCGPAQRLAPMAFISYGSAGRPNPERHECKHVHVARSYFLREILISLAKQHRSP